MRNKINNFLDRVTSLKAMCIVACITVALHMFFGIATMLAPFSFMWFVYVFSGCFWVYTAYQVYRDLEERKETDA